MFGLTGKEVYEYGIYVFILWIATFLVRKMWSLIEGKLTSVDIKVCNIDNNVMENKQLNLDITKNLKDVAVIQAQTLGKFEETTSSLNKMEQAVRNTLNISNGGNPVIKEILKRLDKVEETK